MQKFDLIHSFQMENSFDPRNQMISKFKVKCIPFSRMVFFGHFPTNKRQLVEKLRLQWANPYGTATTNWPNSLQFELQTNARRSVRYTYAAYTLSTFKKKMLTKTLLSGVWSTNVRNVRNLCTGNHIRTVIAIIIIYQKWMFTGGSNCCQRNRVEQ